jgi:hypothetical protein
MADAITRTICGLITCLETGNTASFEGVIWGWATNSETTEVVTTNIFPHRVHLLRALFWVGQLRWKRLKSLLHYEHFYPSGPSVEGVILGWATKVETTEVVTTNIFPHLKFFNRSG